MYEENQKLYKALAAPFAEEDILFRAIQKSKDGTKSQFTPYVRKNKIIDRLNDVLGESWSYSVKTTNDPGMPGVICDLAIEFPAGSPITRSGADCQFNNQRKPNAQGGQMGQDYSLPSSFTKAFVTAAEMFGIGAYLYGMQTQYLEIDEWGKPTQKLTLEMCSKKFEQVPTTKKDAPSPPMATSTTVPAAANAPSVPPANKSGGKPPTPTSPPTSGQPQTFKIGKHKGKPLSEVPMEYIEWAFENMDSLKPGTQYFSQAFFEAVTVQYDIYQAQGEGAGINPTEALFSSEDEIPF
jgi:hypothetical protein